MLAKQIKEQMFAAMKARNTVEKEILKVVLGEIDTDVARSGQPCSDDKVIAIVRKLVKSNRETLKLTSDESARTTVLDKLLPQTLDVDAIVAALADVKDDIVAAGNDGQATGIAMRHLKGAGAAVDGKSVSQAVKKLRPPPPPSDNAVAEPEDLLEFGGDEQDGHPLRCERGDEQDADP